MLNLCFLIHTGTQTIKNIVSSLILPKNRYNVIFNSLVFPGVAQISEDMLTW